MTNNTYVTVEISDLHGGAFDPKQWYHELEEGFLKYIENLMILDAVILTGDLFDSKISVNSEHAKYIFKFVMKTLEICIEKGAKFRAIKGTESHDNKQLHLLELIFKDTKCDARFIHTLEDEWLYPDLHVLYIPEEYMPDKDAYYAEKFKEKYHMVFGHGMIQEGLLVAAKQESEATMSRAPIFKSAELLDICTGPIFFGHIHKRIIIKERIHYVNSFSRWAFGEEDDKGFYLCTIVPGENKYKTEYIVNKLARRFDTVEVQLIPDKAQTEQIDYLVKLVDRLIVDFLRLEVNIPEDYPSGGLITPLLYELFGSRKGVKIKVNNESNLKKNKEMEEKVNILLEKYGFLFDKSLTHEDKIVKYIKVKYGHNISIDRLRELLYEDIMKGA